MESGVIHPLSLLYLLAHVVGWRMCIYHTIFSQDNSICLYAHRCDNLTTQNLTSHLRDTFPILIMIEL